MYNEENCANCDNRQHPKNKFDGQEFVTIALEAIEQTKQQFKAKHVVNVICGKSSSSVRSAGHEELEVFGKGDEKDENFWNSIIRQMIWIS